MMNKYYKEMLLKNFEVIVRQQRGGIYRMYLIKKGVKTGDYVEFFSRGRASEIAEKALTAKEGTNISNALCALNALVNENF